MKGCAATNEEAGSQSAMRNVLVGAQEEDGEGRKERGRRGI